jgi:hypothetical protein
MADRQARARWPVEVQRRAEELGRDRDLSGVDVRRAIGEELGADVPMSTVCRWVAAVRRRRSRHSPSLGGASPAGEAEPDRERPSPHRRSS